MASKKDKEKKRKQLGGEELKAALLKDDAFKKYRRMVKSISEKLDIEALSEEADNLHEGRPSRNLKGTNPGGQKISDAALHDGSNRSRLARIYTKLLAKRDLLDIAVAAAKMHVLRNYRDYLDLSEYRTKQERSEVVNVYVSRGLTLIANINSLLSRLDVYIKDIDQMHFQLKLSYNALALLHDKNKEL